MAAQILKALAVLLFFLLPTTSAQAISPGDVVISEIAWMGTTVSYNDEWIELYNNTDSSINLDGWVFKAVDESPEIKLTGEVLANSFYLLERTDDDTVPNVTANQIYTGALDNKGENLELYNDSGHLIDSVDCSSGWLAGDNATKQTMEKRDSHWQTSQNPEGTPKAENSKPQLVESQPVQSRPVESGASAKDSPQQITYSPTEADSAGNSLPVAVIAAIVAIFSGTIILTLKRKLKVT